MPARSPLIKVFLLFMAGIILPTTFLVYLGVLSIRSETLLLKKESQERAGKTAQAIQDQAQAVISETLAPFAELARALTRDPAVSSAALRDFRKTHSPPVTLLLLLDSANHLLYPVRETRSAPVPPLPPLNLEQRQQMQQAEQSEFKARDYAAALKGYKALHLKVGPARWKAILLNSQAGCLMKLNDYDAAEARYHELLNRYSQEPDIQGYPFGLVIASQLGELQQAKRRPDLAANNYLRVFQELLGGRWELSWDELQFFARYLVERIHPLEPQMTDGDRSRWRALSAQWEDLKQAVSKAQSFLASRWPELHRTLREHNRSGMPFLLFADTPPRRAIAYAPAYDTRGGNLQYTVVAELDTSAFLQKLNQTVRSLAEASNLAYRLETGDGTRLARSDQMPEGKRWTMGGDLSQTYPALKLAAAPLSSVPVERAAAQRRRVYIGMVILAALVILIALYVTWYAVSREMEVAHMKARFVAGISHELKTPLSIISFIGQKLQLGRFGSPEEVQDYYTMITEESSRLKSLIDEVLDFSRLMENRQPYHKEPTDLAALVRETAERFRHSQKEEHMKLECRCEPASCMMPLDPEAISRAILNLLDNAVKYSPRDRTLVKLSLRQADHSAVIEIEDGGYGIPPEETALVFERFYRGRSASDQQSVRGAGLGLSIVRHIVEAHGGRVELQSTVGKGSIFSIRIPMNPGDA